MSKSEKKSTIKFSEADRILETGSAWLTGHHNFNNRRPPGEKVPIVIVDMSWLYFGNDHGMKYLKVYYVDQCGRTKTGIIVDREPLMSFEEQIEKYFIRIA